MPRTPPEAAPIENGDTSSAAPSSSCKLSCIFFLVCHHGNKCNNWCRTKQLNLLLEIGKSENQDLQSSPSCCSLMPKRAFGNQEIKTTQLLQPQVEKFLMTPFIRTYK